MSYRARTLNSGARSIAKRLASASFPVVVGVTIAMLLLSILERMPITLPPVDQGWRGTAHD